MDRKMYRIGLATALVAVILIPLAARGIMEGIPSIFKVSTLDGIAGGVLAGFIAAGLLDLSRRHSSLRLNPATIESFIAIEELGIRGIAKRGGEPPVGRTRVPKSMVKAAKGEIFLLAYSGVTTIRDYERILLSKLRKSEEFTLGCILINPDSELASNFPGSTGTSFVKEIEESIEALVKLQRDHELRVKLRVLDEAPTFTSIAFDVGIISDTSGPGLLSVVPRLDGEIIHHAVILDLDKREGGIWATYATALKAYWGIAQPYRLS